MASSVDIWLSEFEDAMKLADEILSKVKERDVMVKNQEDSTRLVSAIRRKISMLSSKADRLEDLLKEPVGIASISGKETKRRLDMLVGIRYKAKQMSSLLSSAQSTNRSALLGDGGRPVQGVETSRTADLDNRGVLVLQQQMIHEQDEELMILEETVGKTKHIALEIRDELDLQSGLLDEMHEDIDSTNSRMKVAQRKLISITKRAKSCSCIYLVLMFIALVLILLTIIKIIKYF